MSEKIEFRITAEYLPDGSGKVSIQGDSEAPFKFWMIATEYMMHKTCQKSNAGYEKALELLCKGATTYQDVIGGKNETYLP